MRRFKRLVAGFMCLCMMATSNGVTSFAAETEPQDVSVQMQATEEQDAQTATDSDALMDAETTAQTDVPDAETDPETDTETMLTDAEENQVLLNYVVLGSDYIETPATQYVVADMGSEGQTITDAVLHYVNHTTGTEYEKTVDRILGTTVLFNLEFADDSESGTYEVLSIDYTVDGTDYTVTLKDAGMEAQFGVNEYADTNPDAWIVDEESEECDTGVIVTDISSGETLDAQGLAQAIADSETGSCKSGTSKKDGMVIVLDAGHSGSDPGTSNVIDGVTYCERDITLKITNYCKAELDKCTNAVVYMTRTDNTEDWSLENRVDYARQVGADVLISFHVNAAGPSATGAEVLIPNSNYNADIHNTAEELGTKILEKLSALGLYNRGNIVRNSQAEYAGDTVKIYPDGSLGDYYYLNHYSKLYGFPGIIVEHAFLSNPDEARKYLTSDAQLKKLGQADAAAIIEYYGLTTDPNAVEYTVYKGVDYKAVYNYDYYISHNPDIAKKYGGSKYQTLKHFVNYGMAEGRRASKDFDVTSYRYRYADLRKSYGMDLKKYYMHYINKGKKEGRKATGTKTMQNPVTVYKGVDYKAVYSYSYYTKNHPEVIEKCGDDDTAVLKYFVENGMKEAQQAIATFDPVSYRNQYADLRKLYSRDYVKYYMHYINFGKKEGRKATGVTELQGTATVYEGVDYSAVYNYNYYIAKYADVKNAYGDDDYAVLRHFVLFGINEGRRGSADFDVKSYRNKYADLRRVYGNDLRSYYLHYINYGKKERRQATGVKTLQDATTIYNGIDYSAVYDYNYYIEKYPDIKKAFGGDENAVIAHFVQHGMQEGRQGNERFSLSYYRSKYADVRNAYGSNNAAYYMHYIRFGKAEGRKGSSKDVNPTEDKYYSIMGTSTVSVEQMVKYYNANATYPEYYKNSDAPTIEDFCQIYLEECKAEGVKAEVAFCQAMMETGFLNFGGAVDISQYNFAGIGATDSGGAPATFSSVRQGVRAQVQHLKAYASTEALKKKCVDPRFSLVTRGSAKYLEWLGIQENPNGLGWASAKNYGYNIRKLYIAKLKTY
ncbi:MAG: N-acetylmuramoyl-L-alanine amidase [Wujia sp.]